MKIDPREQAIIDSLAHGESKSALQLIQESLGILSRNTVLDVLGKMECNGIVWRNEGDGWAKYRLTQQGKLHAR